MDNLKRTSEAGQCMFGASVFDARLCQGITWQPGPGYQANAIRLISVIQSLYRFKSTLSTRTLSDKSTKTSTSNANT